MSSDNGKQILHQATVTDLQYGIFVTVVLADGQSQIIQQKVVMFSQNDKNDHLVAVNAVGVALVGCLYKPELLESDFQKMEDCFDYSLSQSLSYVVCCT